MRRDQGHGDRGSGPGTALLAPAQGDRPSWWRRPAVIGAGSFLMLLGLPGIVLPVLPGWLLIGIGLVVLAQEVRSARRLLQWLQRRVPGLATAETCLQQVLLRLRRRL